VAIGCGRFFFGIFQQLGFVAYPHIRHQTHDKMSENKIPNPLASNEKTVAAFELRINANKLLTIIIATATQRIVIVGCKLLIAVFCGTSRIEIKHKPSAIAPAMLMVSLDAMMPNR
jgi:hypothetical protein